MIEDKEKEKARRELDNYIKKNLAKGYSSKSIKKVLVNNGLERSFVDKVMRKYHIKNVLVSPAFVVMIILMVASLLLFKLVTVGLAPIIPPELLTVSYDYMDEVNLSVNESSEYIWYMENIGLLKSVRLDGSVSKGGYFEVYLEYENESYLILDSLRLGGGVGDVSGLAVGDVTNNESFDDGSEGIVDVDIESEPLINNSLDNNSIINESINNENDSLDNKSINNESLDKKIIITTEGGGRKDIGEIFEFNIKGEFNWGVDYDRVCTMWGVNSEWIECYGSSECCGFSDMDSSGLWNSSFYLSYGRYDSKEDNVVSARVVYYDVNLSVPYSDIVYSDVSLLDADFYKEGIRFKDVCLETCILPGFNASSYKIRFVVSNGSLVVDNIRYSIEKEIFVSRNAPLLVREIDNISIYKNEFMNIDLSSYFYDEDGDELDYSGYRIDDVSMVIRDSIATLRPAYNFTGKRYIYFTASDGYYNVTSNVFYVNVIERPLKVEEVNVSEELVKPSVVINKPVRWIKKVNASDRVINLSVNISSDALNVTVRDVKEDRVISSEKIKVIDNGIVKNYSAYKAEKRVKQIEKIESRLTIKKVEIIMEDPTAKGEIGSINEELLELRNEKNKLTEYAVAEVSEGSNVTSVIIEDIVENVEIEYYTEGPISEEEEIVNGKRIVISSDVHYENISAYTELPIEASVSVVHLYWIINGARVEIEFVALDNNNNGLVDIINWSINSLSNQTYELEIVIIHAEHLDKNRDFVSNIYEEVKEIDSITYTIPKKEYVRAYFERNLSNENVIDIFVKDTESATIKVYEKDSDVIVGEIEDVVKGAYYISLNHTYPQSIFDMKSVSKDVIYDYIHDAKPAPLNSVSLTSPTENQQIELLDSFVMECTVDIGNGGVISPTVYFRLDEDGNGCDSGDTLIPEIGTGGTIVYGSDTTQNTIRCSNCNPSVSTIIYGYEVGGPYTICCHANDRGTHVVSSETITAEVGVVQNLPPGIPQNLQCDGTDDCNIVVDQGVDLEASGSTDPEGDEVTYSIEALLGSCSNSGACDSCGTQQECSSCSSGGCILGSPQEIIFSDDGESWKSGNCGSGNPWDSCNINGVVDGNLQRDANEHSGRYAIIANSFDPPGKEHALQKQLDLSSCDRVYVEFYWYGAMLDNADGDYGRFSINDGLWNTIFEINEGNQQAPNGGDNTPNPSDYDFYSQEISGDYDFSSPVTFSWSYHMAGIEEVVYYDDLNIICETFSCSGILDCSAYSDQPRCERCSQCSWGPSGWTEIGSHVEGSSFNWDASLIPNQDCVNLRTRAIDLMGSNTYSDYFEKGSCLDIYHPPAISVSMSETLAGGIIWDIVSVPVFEGPAEGNNGGGITAYDVMVSSSGAGADVYMKADGDLTTGGGDVIALSNEKFSYSSIDNTVSSGTKYSLTTNYVDNKIGDNLPDGSNIYLKFFLDVPPGQAAGTYSNQVDVIGVPNGEIP